MPTPTLQAAHVSQATSEFQLSQASRKPTPRPAPLLINDLNKPGSAPAGWLELKQSSALHAIACPAPRDQHALEAGQSPSSSRCKQNTAAVSTPSAEVAKLLLKTKQIVLNNAHHAVALYDLASDDAVK